MSYGDDSDLHCYLSRREKPFLNDLWVCAGEGVVEASNQTFA